MMSTIPTQELAELLDAEGLKPVRELLANRSPATRWRWIHVGVHGVRLEAIRNGNSWETSKAAVARFRARLAGQSVTTPVETTSSLARRAAAARARRLERGKRKG